MFCWTNTRCAWSFYRYLYPWAAWYPRQNVISAGIKSWNLESEVHSTLKICKTPKTHPGLLVKRDAPHQRVEKVKFFKFLRVHISADFFWTSNSSALRLLRKQKLHQNLLVTYHSTIESMLISVWHSSCTEANMKRLQNVTITKPERPEKSLSKQRN